ncbi:MAG: hypothetical protein Fur0021_16900 [Candidatus Promineifilaceae bacterium]
MKLKLTFLGLLLLVLVACGGQMDVAVVPAANDPMAAPASLDLPDTVDVQTVASVKDRADVVVLDVREQWEYDEQHIPGVTLIPMAEVPNRLSEIPTDKTVIVTCRSGNRSGQVTDYLRQAGYTNVHNMSGGILAWEQAGYTVEP